MEIRLPRPHLPQNLPRKKVLIPVIIAIVIIVGIVVWLNWPYKEYKNAKMSPTSDVYQNIKREPTDSLFANTLDLLGYDKFLQDNGPFTVFAPIDSSYNNMPASTRDFFAEKDNRGSLHQMILYHIVKGKYTFADLKDGMRLKTLEGETLTISKKGNYLSLDGHSYIKIKDLVSSNGVVHLVTDFLIPKTMLN